MNAEPGKSPEATDREFPSRGSAVAVAVRSQPDDARLAEAIFPILRTALCRTVSRALSTFVRRLNRFILYTFSIQGMQWRIEAMRKGKTFAEIVAEHGVPWRVGQVFLIHRQSGILLRHEHGEGRASGDADMVSGMLTALESFVRDSFAAERADRLKTIQMGELTLCVEQGPDLVIAGLVKGTPTDDVRDALQQALARIQTELAEQTRAFKGDTKEFDRAAGALRAFLSAHLRYGREPIVPFTRAALAAPFILLLVWAVIALEREARWRQYLSEIRDQPGLMLISHGTRWGHRHIVGLRDPLAPDPVAMLSESGFDPAHVYSQWRPYQALDRPLVLARARRALAPPATVTLGLKDGILRAYGSAPGEWMAHARSMAKGLGGIQEFDTSGLVDEDETRDAAWQAYVDGLSSEPGVVVVGHGTRDGRHYVNGLRDPLARDPASLLPAFGLDASRVDARWQPYMALDPEVVLARIRNALSPPETVTLALHQGVLVATGTASHRWTVDLRARALALAGVNGLKTDGLVDTDARELRDLKARIEASTFFFVLGAPDLWRERKNDLTALTGHTRAVSAVARRMGEPVRIEIRGYVRTSGDADADEAASRSLAQRFLQGLRWQDTDSVVFTARGMGVDRMPLSSRAGQPYDARVELAVLTD